MRLRIGPGRGLVILAFVLFVLAPASVDAQWYFGNYLGANHTAPATVSINQPGRDTSLLFHDVNFDARPFKTAPYYGARIGRLLGSEGRLGLEFEFIHLKVISRTNLPVHVTGRLDGVPFDSTLPMNFLVERYSMAHGVNFLLLNLVVRRPLGGSGESRPASLVFRVGAGGTRPGVDTSVRGVSIHHYQLAGFGAQAAAGVDLRLRRFLSALVEYKFTYATPTIAIDGGNGHTTARTQQVAFGFAIGFSR